MSVFQPPLEKGERIAVGFAIVGFSLGLCGLAHTLASCSAAMQRDVMSEIRELAGQVCVRTDPIDVCVSKCSAHLAARDAADAGSDQ